MRHVEEAREVGVDDSIPLVRRHLVEHRILGDACIVDQNIDRAEIRLDLRNACRAGGVIADVPLVGLDAGL